MTGATDPSAQPELVVVVVYPDLLGTYGDGGNGIVLAQRARWRGYRVSVREARSGSPLPEGDLYCLGGGEDGPQVRAASLLIEDGTLARQAGRGVPVLGVCAGFQILGHRFPDADDRPHRGLGLLDITTRKGRGARAVGEVLARFDRGPRPADGRRLPDLTGFENHGGVTTVGPGAAPLARVLTGVGNGGGDRVEGAWHGRVVGTYLHGPVLARNVQLADLLLGWALEARGSASRLAPLDDTEEEALRAERLAATEVRGLRGAARPFSRGFQRRGIGNPISRPAQPG